MNDRQPFSSVLGLMRQRPSLVEAHLISRTWALPAILGRQAPRPAR